MSATARTILVVEDDDGIRRVVRGALHDAGHRVHEAGTCAKAIVEASTSRPDLVLLDLGLPDRDGVEFIRAFRGWSAKPVLVLSARTAEDQKVAALDAGADDYLSKPFGVSEMLARVRAMLRRSARGTEGAAVRFGDVVVDLENHSVRRGDAPVHLTPVEFRLLAELLARPGAIITHHQLLRVVWGPGHANDVHYLRVHMGHLREKLETQAARPRYLVTVTGVGYRFMP